MLHPQFASPGLASQALVRAGKPSPTARRYAKYHSKFLCKNTEKYLTFIFYMSYNYNMSRKKVIIAIILFLSVILLFGYVTGEEKYRTYRLEGVPLVHEKSNFLIFWISRYYDKGQGFKAFNNTNNEGEFKFFSFKIEHNIYFYGGKQYYDEPYNLSMSFNIYDVKNIIVNKFIFKTKSKVIDLREVVGISSYYRSEEYPRGYYGTFDIDFSEEDVMDFRRLGTIDVKKLNNDERIVAGISFNYDNVDIIFNRDKNFTIECDIIFESDIEDYETYNYSFTTKFNKIKYTNEKMQLLCFLFSRLLFSIFL
jgi:hypothetical protein